MVLFRITLSGSRLEYCKTPCLNNLTAIDRAKTELIAKITIPISASGIDKLPTAFLSISGIGAVSGKKLKNLTIGEFGIDTNSVTA